TTAFQYRHDATRGIRTQDESNRLETGSLNNQPANNLRPTPLHIPSMCIQINREGYEFSSFRTEVVWVCFLGVYLVFYYFMLSGVLPVLVFGFLGCLVVEVFV
ncbi:hypothetical protein, partial [Mobiluncus mulieris]|uniref:hypothetical protein n=1 Tax=Mobiluncus mulieris TaxID=2052 RepID=UPI001B8AFE37